MPRKPKGARKNAPFLLVLPAPLRSAGCHAAALTAERVSRSLRVARSASLRGGALYARSSPAGCLVCLPAGCAAPSVFAPLRLGRGALGCRYAPRFWEFCALAPLVSARRRLATPLRGGSPLRGVSHALGLTPAAFGAPWLVGFLVARFPRLSPPALCWSRICPLGWLVAGRPWHRAMGARSRSRLVA